MLGFIKFMVMVKVILSKFRFYCNNEHFDDIIIIIPMYHPFIKSHRSKTKEIVVQSNLLSEELPQGP